MESEFIAWLRKRLRGHRRLQLGPGDDAAVLRLADRSGCVVTTDLLTDGVDFDLCATEARRIGHKALAVNLSDLAAMAAVPVAAVVALALPRQDALAIAKQLYEGMLPLAERFDLAIAGGDTNTWDGPLVIAVTAIGESTEGGVLTRRGARPGDRIVVTGEFGGSIQDRHLDFIPRVREALLLHEQYELHAGLDCSDGLSLDLWRLCVESDCGAIVDVDRVPISAAALRIPATAGRPGSGFGVQHASSPVGEAAIVRGGPLDHALCDGEDFELILAVGPDTAARMISDQPLAEARLTDIGEFVLEQGLWQRDGAGNRATLAPRGWEH